MRATRLNLQTWSLTLKSKETCQYTPYVHGVKFDIAHFQHVKAATIRIVMPFLSDTSSRPSKRVESPCKDHVFYGLFSCHPHWSSAAPGVFMGLELLWVESLWGMSLCDKCMSTLWTKNATSSYKVDVQFLGSGPVPHPNRGVQSVGCWTKSIFTFLNSLTVSFASPLSVFIRSSIFYPCNVGLTWTCSLLCCSQNVKGPMRCNSVTSRKLVYIVLVVCLSTTYHDQTREKESVCVWVSLFDVI